MYTCMFAQRRILSFKYVYVHINVHVHAFNYYIPCAMYMYIYNYTRYTFGDHVYIIIPGTLLEIMYNTQFSGTAVRDVYLCMYICIIHHVYCMFMYIHCNLNTNCNLNA